VVVVTPGTDPVAAATLVDAVEELRGAGAEAMQLRGSTGGPVRIVASTAFVDGPAGITVDGVLLTGSFTISVIGPGPTMRTALTIPGGVSDAVARVGGTVIVDEPASVTVDALHASTELKYAKPAD